MPPQRFTPVSLWQVVRGLGLPIQVHPVRRSVFEARRNDPTAMSFDIAREGIPLLGAMGGEPREAS